MSDTPRTDAAYFKPHATMYDLAGEMKLMERELNSANDRIKNLESALCTVQNIDKVNAYQDLESANERIKRLEAAVDAILNANNDDEQYEAMKQWYKAKEAKL